MEQIENRIVVEDAMHQLAELERELLILRYYNNLRYADIAQILKMPASTARYQTKQAEKHMKQILKGGGL